MVELVSVIILNWNGGNFVLRCLDSALRQTYASLEVIVIDNGSTDGSYEKIVSDYASLLSVIRNSENRGFTGGMNQGIAASSGEFLLLLNSDVFLEEQYIEQVIARFASDTEKHIGVIGGKLYWHANGHSTREIDHAGFYLKARMSVSNSTNHVREEFVFGPSGACPMVRRQTLDDVALSPHEWFDETYFAYNEDIDLWFRCQIRGWRVLFVPSAFGWHIHSASVGGKMRLYERSDFLQFHALKNRYMTILKNYPLLLLVTMAPVLILVEISVPLAFLIISPRTLLNLGRSWRYIFIHWSQIMKKRWHVQSRRQVSTCYLLSLYRGL